MVVLELIFVVVVVTVVDGVLVEVRIVVGFHFLLGLVIVCFVVVVDKICLTGSNLSAGNCVGVVVCCFVAVVK